VAMVRPRHALFAALALALPAVGLGACRAPTQARVVITTTTSCADVAAGVAIVVKDRPVAAEAALLSGFVTTTTKACQGGTIGDLVLAPGESTGAIVVTARYKGQDSATCRPPDYKDCIVARRAFSFVDHETLTIPISLDPDCVNVPCDAISTCSKGKCVSSSASCSGGSCAVDPSVPVTPDAGGLLPDGAVPPSDAGARDGEASEGGGDAAGGDAGDDGGGDGDGGGGIDGGTFPPTDFMGPFNCLAGAPSCAAVCPASTFEACYSNSMISPPRPVTCRGKAAKGDLQFCCGSSDCAATGGPNTICCASDVPICMAACPITRRVCRVDADCPSNQCDGTTAQIPGLGGGWHVCLP